MERKKKAGVAILLSNKMHFKPTQIKRERRALHNGKRVNATKRANNSKYIQPNTAAPSYIKQVLNNLQRDLDSHTIIVGDFNTPLSTLDNQ